MRPSLEIENIGEMRRQEGIDDVELLEAIRRLQAGNLVRLTLLSPAKSFAGETVLVRITSIRGDAFRGKLMSAPSSANGGKLRAGSPLVFSADHIHSIPKEQPTLAR
jgi:hypothetical protein